MPRKAYLIKLYPGKGESFDLAHRPPWPEVERLLREHGVEAYTIYRHELDLFLHVAMQSEARWNALIEEEGWLRWWRELAPLMQSHPDGTPVMTELPVVYDLG